MPPLLEARHLRKVFRSGGERFGPSTETIAVSDFSLSIDADRPSFTTIAGESGSGKTTIARMLLGVLTPAPARCSTKAAMYTTCKRRNGSNSAKTYRRSFKIPLKCTIPSTRSITS